MSDIEKDKIIKQKKKMEKICDKCGKEADMLYHVEGLELCQNCFDNTDFDKTYNKELKEEPLERIANDVHTIKTIVLIWTVLGLIGLLIFVIVGL